MTAQIVRGCGRLMTVDIVVLVHDGDLNVVLVLFSSAQLDPLDVDQYRAQIEQGAEEIGSPDNTRDRFGVDRMDGEDERREETRPSVRKHIGREYVHEVSDSAV